MASKDFLTTLTHKLAPIWASNELAALIKNERLGRPMDTLDEYSRVFSGIAQELTGIKPSKAPGIFITIRNHSDTDPLEPLTGLSKERFKNHKCLCRKSLINKHY
jgi:hypothetical protein